MPGLTTAGVGSYYPFDSGNGRWAKAVTFVQCSATAYFCENYKGGYQWEAQVL